MEKSLTTLLSFIFMISLYSQNESIDPKPKGMVFVPQGSYDMTNSARVAVDAFWMSNEITNAEYREFVEWTKSNPDKKLYQNKYSVEVFNDPKKGVTKDTVIVKTIPIEVSTFIADMIDPLSLEKTNKNFINYFTDKKYDDYPVVGISFKMAQYYCLWKTMIENDQLKEKGLPPVQSYRIPLESEWEYVAQQPVSMKDKEELIQPVNTGNCNDWDLFHLNDNVSEWVSHREGITGIIRGGSWKSGNSIAERQVINPDSQEPFVGLRIVRSYVP